METALNLTARRIIADAYEQLRPRLINYIAAAINSRDDAEDLTQDVFLRLLEYRAVLNAETLKSFVYRVARNIIYDYIRHSYCVEAAATEITMTSTDIDNTTEAKVLASELEHIEQAIVAQLPQQRRLIYEMSRNAELSVAEIASNMELSIRTVENHLRLGRRDVRNAIERIYAIA